MFVDDVLSDIPDDQILASVEGLHKQLNDLIGHYNVMVIRQGPEAEIDDSITGRKLKEVIKQLPENQQKKLLNDFNKVNSVGNGNSYDAEEARQERKMRHWMKKAILKTVIFVVVMFTFMVVGVSFINKEIPIDAFNGIIKTAGELFKTIPLSILNRH